VLEAEVQQQIVSAALLVTQRKALPLVKSLLTMR
jgi:hypothetical protein